MAALLAPAEVSTSVSGGQEHARATVDVPPASWPDALRAARDDTELACDFFDWLSAVDELAAGFDVVAHLWSTTHRHGVLLRTRVPRAAPTIPSAVTVYPGAAWHERETHEMFGIGFAGHADLKPLLLPPEFEGHPLRKEFVLASRVAKPWPGAKEPGESEAGGGRRPIRPPGVPAPGEWGTTPAPAGAAGVGEGPRGGVPARPARERPARPAPGARPARTPRPGGAADGPAPADPRAPDATAEPPADAGAAPAARGDRPAGTDTGPLPGATGGTGDGPARSGPPADRPSPRGPAATERAHDDGGTT
ncbi:NADH-quinone oxidoreductase subunit C [Micromonospora sp. HSS6-12]|uniref:NADH-quinone oxidoreductase n=1 Tax=Micromonospora thermarum TaxID=2720024 RepID=A0ABX0Z5W6_9ACTN|nr:NADH-quinone oxidoreductase subunit C [Micromonospora thermarum]